MKAELVIRFIGGILAGTAVWQFFYNVLTILQPGTYPGPIILVAAILLAFGIAFLLTPYVTTRPFFYLLHHIRHMPASDLVAGAAGLTVGLLIGLLVAIPLSWLPYPLGPYLPLVASALLGYLGMTALVTHKREVFQLFGLPISPGRERDRQETPGRIIVDTSAIIDGRIADISQTGFISGPLVIPRFVLQELQRIADSPDPLRRNRGRRGLDILNRLQKDLAVPIEVSDVDVDGNLDVDAKLVRLAKMTKCPIITNDYNLNRVAGIQGVKVLNINELANAVKSVVLPGEEMSVKIIQEGKEYGQGVGYLDDGTMVVVENGRRYLNSSVDIVVTRVLQTVAGRMIFAHTKGTGHNGQAQG